MSRLPAAACAGLAVAVLGLAGCGGSSHHRSGGAQTVPMVSTLPVSGTVRLRGQPGRIYTVAAAGTTLRLGDIAVRVLSVSYTARVVLPVRPPGTHVFALVRLEVRNETAATRTMAVTQIWLQTGRAYLAAAGAHVGNPLVGVRVPAGGVVMGTLVFPLPARPPSAMLLVYRFADTTAIAHATRIGLLRLG